MEKNAFQSIYLYISLFEHTHPAYLKNVSIVSQKNIELRGGKIFFSDYIQKLLQKSVFTNLLYRGSRRMVLPYTQKSAKKNKMVGHASCMTAKGKHLRHELFMGKVFGFRIRFGKKMILK